jgi:type IX secretion system PorP/SprF family membrane protein
MIIIKKLLTATLGKKRYIYRWALPMAMLLTISSTLFAQQQFSYTQYIDNLTPIIPAWSLTRENSEVNFLARKQWVGIDGAPTTFMTNGFATLPETRATIGMFVMKDKVAIENLTEVNAFFAKAIPLDREIFLSVSINGGFRRYNANYSSLDPNDPALFGSDINETEVNAGASVMVFAVNKFYAGISMPRLSLQDLGAGSVAASRRFKNFYYLTTGYETDLTDEISFQSSALVAYTANVPLQADISLKAYVNHTVGLGINYRTSNEIAFLSSFSIDKMRLGYSYLSGFGSTKLSGISQGTHEITLSFLFGSGASYKDNGNRKSDGSFY